MWNLISEYIKGTRVGAFCDAKKGLCLYMEIILCIVVSAVTSVAVLNFFAYRYFDTIDKYVKDLFRNFYDILAKTERKE